MRRRRGIKWPTLAIFCLLFMSLLALGVTYAQWTGVLQIGQTLTTGTLALQPPREGFRAFLVDSEGKPANGQKAMSGVSARLSEDGETLLLTVDGGLAAADLAGDGFLKLEVPLQQGAESTVTSVERTRTDLSASADEELDLIPSDPEVVVGEEILFAKDLPEGALDGFAAPLTAKIYRQVEEGADGPIAAVYLRLTQKSRDALAGLAAIDTLTFAAADPLSGPLLAAAGDATELEAHVRVHYTCALSLYVEQGNENSLPLPGEE